MAKPRLKCSLCSKNRTAGAISPAPIYAIKKGIISGSKKRKERYTPAVIPTIYINFLVLPPTTIYLFHLIPSSFSVLSSIVSARRDQIMRSRSGMIWLLVVIPYTILFVKKHRKHSVCWFLIKLHHFFCLWMCKFQIMRKKCKFSSLCTRIVFSISIKRTACMGELYSYLMMSSGF